MNPMQKQANGAIEGPTEQEGTSDSEHEEWCTLVSGLGLILLAKLGWNCFVLTRFCCCKCFARLELSLGNL